MFYLICLFILLHKQSIGDIHVLERDCEIKRHNYLSQELPSKNLIFESSQKRLKLVLNCTFCDHIMLNRTLDDGKWYFQKKLQGGYELISNNSENPKLIPDGRVLIKNYNKNTGFYSCHPDNAIYKIRVKILIDYIDKSKDQLLSDTNKFLHRELFQNESAREIKLTEEKIQAYSQNFLNIYKLIYSYYKDTKCSKCNQVGEFDQVGIKKMIFKCTLTELSYIEPDQIVHVEPSVSCNSVLVKNFNNEISKEIRHLTPKSFQFPCNVSCDSRLPNLTEFSVTDRPSIVSEFEAEQKKYMIQILDIIGDKPVPDSIQPDLNLNKLNLSVLVEREFKLKCPIDKQIEDSNYLIFWYLNHTLISPLKLRLQTDSKLSCLIVFFFV